MAAAGLVGRLRLWMRYLVRTESYITQKTKHTEAGGTHGQQDDTECDEERTRCARESVPETFDRPETSKDLLCTDH